MCKSAPYSITQTQRLSIRRILPEDYQDAFLWRGDPRVCRYMISSPRESPEALPPFLNAQVPTSDTRIVTILHEKHSNQAVGTVGFFYDAEADSWSFAYCIRYEDWNKGYTTEAVNAMMDYVRRKYGAHRFEAEFAAENIASGRVMEKCGLRYHHDSTFENKDTGEVFSSKVYRLDE